MTRAPKYLGPFHTLLGLGEGHPSPGVWAGVPVHGDTATVQGILYQWVDHETLLANALLYFGEPDTGLWIQADFASRMTKGHRPTTKEGHEQKKT